MVLFHSELCFIMCVRFYGFSCVMAWCRTWVCVVLCCYMGLWVRVLVIIVLVCVVLSECLCMDACVYGVIVYMVVDFGVCV